jgi:O-antigen/teichoic acid export membrane protein
LFSQLVARIAQTLATRAASVVLALVTTIAIARALGPEGRGLYAVAIAVAAIGVQFGNLGLQTSNTYFSSRDSALLQTLASNTVTVVVVVAAFSALAWGLFTLAPSVAPVHGALLALALAGVPLGLAYMLLQNLLLGVQRVWEYNAAELLTRITLLVLVLALAAAGGVRPAVVISASLAAQAIGAAWCWRGLGLPRKLAPGSWPVFVESVRYGLRPYVAAFFAFLLLRGDLLMVKYMRGSTQAGYYSIAVSMSDLLYILPTVVGAVLFPYLVRQHDIRRQWRIALAAAAGVTGMLGLAALLSVWLARPAVSLLFGTSFVPAVPAFTVLAGAIIFYGANNILSIAAASFGYPWFAAFVWIPAAALNFALNAILIPRHGIVGSAVASLVCYAAVLVAQFAWLARYVARNASET